MIRLAACCALLLALTACRQTRAPADSGADARIRYYKARIAGQGTYPAEARLGLAYLQKARETGEAEYHERALEHLLTSLQHQPNFEALLGAALVYIERHEFAKAHHYARQAVDAMPGNLDAQGVLFDSLLALGQIDRAAEVARTMMNLHSGFAAWTRQAALRSYRGELAGAVESMQRACDAADAASLPASTRAWARVRLGSLQIANCDANAARENYASALELHSGYYLALEHLAELHAAQGRAREAMRIYRRLLQRIPDAKYRLALADLYESDGDVAKARREQQQALASLRAVVAAGSKAELRELALLLLDSEGSAAEGLKLAQADWENRKDATAADTLAWAHFRNGHGAEAVKFARQAVSSGTKDPQILLHAGAINARAGRMDEARRLIAQARACRVNLSPSGQRMADRLWLQVAPR